MSEIKLPRISVLVKVEEPEIFLEKLIQDFEKQTLFYDSKIEVLLLADSAQNLNLIENIINDKPTFRLIKTGSNPSLPSVWNLALNEANGEFISFSDIRDRHSKYSYEKMLKVFNEFPIAEIVYGNVYQTSIENDSIDSESEKTKLDWINFDRDLLLFGCFIGPMALWKKGLHSKFGVFDEHLKYTADYEFWLRVSQNAVFYHLDEVLGLYYNIENDNESLSREKESLSLQKKYICSYVKTQEDLNRISSKFEFINSQFKNNSYAKNGIELIKKRRKGLEIELSINELVSNFDESPLNAVFEAISNYLQMIRSDDLLVDRNYQSGILYTLKGSCYLMNDQPDEAKKMFEIAIEYDSTNSEFFKQNNLELEQNLDSASDPFILNKKDFINTVSDAIGFFKDDKYGDSLEILLSLGDAFKDSSVNDSLKIKLSEIKEMMGYCNMGVGDYESAHDCFKSALEYNPTSTYACSGLGKLFGTIGNLELSKQMYEWAVKNDNKNKFAIKGLEAVNTQLGLPAEHSSLVEGNISPKVYEAETLIQQGNLSGAEEILQTILDYDPDHIPAINDLSVIKIMQEDFQTAANLILRVVSLEPSNETASGNLEVLEQIVNSKFDYVN